MKNFVDDHIKVVGVGPAGESMTQPMLDAIRDRLERAAAAFPAVPEVALVGFVCRSPRLETGEVPTTTMYVDVDLAPPGESRQGSLRTYKVVAHGDLATNAAMSLTAHDRVIVQGRKVPDEQYGDAIEASAIGPDLTTVTVSLHRLYK